MGGKFKDLKGQRFGRLLVKEQANTSGKTTWKCLCDCGTEKVIAAFNLSNGHTQSCGCLMKDRAKETNTTHGLSKSSEYKSWCKMKERIFNPDCPQYETYGALGIKMEESWVDDFSAFVAHIGLKPKDGKRYTVDRIDHTGHYTVGNVRWADDYQQARNKGKYSANSSGFNGVLWNDKVWPNKKGSTLYAVAVWYGIDGKVQRKYFSVRTLGLLEAFAKACQFRLEMIDSLNAQGAGYAANHGL